MSTENQQNGTVGGAQSNGIKSSSSSSSASSVASSGVSPSGRTAGLQNNSSFLYSSSTMLNREKARQVPPPTLPKYTSSFNAGSNGGAGGGGGTAERLSRDREAGGSYRLASLDRLALRQRILDGEKANGESISIQAKRELFFKGDGASIISSPSVPSVPPPQPPSQAPNSATNTSSSASFTTGSLTSPNTAPTPPSSASSGYSSSAVTPSVGLGSNAKPRLPSAATIPNDASEDSNRRESARTTSKEDSNKETSLLHHSRPTPPTKPKELDGYVGFANLPNQVYRKAVKKGFEFTLMVVGESGLGKSTLINSMFLADIYNSAEYPGPSHRVKKTVAVETSKVLLKENGVNLTLTVVDTPGFGDAVDNSNCWVPVIDYIESKYEEFLNAESRVTRRQIPDSRVHCCLYFVAPAGHGLKPLDVEFMQRLHDKVNIIPVIAKADTMTPDECAHFKKQILNEIAQHKIKIYEFPEVEEEEENKLHKVLRDRVPFAVVGANTVVEHDGKKVRGRKYPWGVAEVENLDHCDFIALRNMVVRTHVQDLKDVTNNVHYENFRCRTLAGLGVDGKPTKASNNLCPPGVMNSFMTVWNPLAQLEEEKREHDNKMKKMETEMEQVFEMKVREKKQKLKESEADLQRRHEQMRRSLEQQVRELEEKRRAFEAEKTAWEQQTGHSIEELRRRSLEANSKETGSVSSEGSGGGSTLRGSRGIGSLLRRHTSFKSPQDSPTQIQLVIQHPEHP
ncbi:PREDICTED: septin-7 isoform X1 [Dinoponera quadriceps]|uniref:Septin-7 isoform X1 n=1 Tax=Dinoponera quadriceps TaxID=609295 RepID=A0A6P3XI44_DINQU|nr:PREDICTED: septin-7 isoform X1 [Dinoponera quadriceps]XP_014477654.1 PREDICTED: septin-7 isoform X1 [Dinoponera quadriceps]XP_014477656.1 PREDICTED: septin-7 isoform X1 [Dinoponera quadriceps]XP_014477657.1 PREDICTED: septin-7 isoform X1 [Dinoponera quadriceps]XP_014477658.1 PREDICTED: septin-7 isoform X1 [Dinoponera quadriceps]XP_014477659.1 PREDICTED: septin-7 isoform X1 [Dinoponera quadriceps]XP_014477660.1 PREDICTED: septin-7 isoform X1 [Dinoponera quadriceps]